MIELVSRDIENYSLFLDSYSQDKDADQLGATQLLKNVINDLKNFRYFLELRNKQDGEILALSSLVQEPEGDGTMNEVAQGA